MASLKSRTKNEVEIVSFIYNYNITLESITFQRDVFSIEYAPYYNINSLYIFPFSGNVQYTNRKLFCTQNADTVIIMIVIIATTTLRVN